MERLSYEQIERLIGKMESLNNELKQYKVSGKLYIHIDSNFSESINLWYSDKCLWLEIPKKRITTFGSELSDIKESYVKYANADSVYNPYMSGILDILNNSKYIIDEVKKEYSKQQSLLNSILG